MYFWNVWIGGDNCEDMILFKIDGFSVNIC